jgi:hypothetical protein
LYVLAPPDRRETRRVGLAAREWTGEPEMGKDFLQLVEMPERDMAVLRVGYDSIEMTEWEKFVKACEKLLRAKQLHLVLDLRELNRILSVFIGKAIEMNFQVRKQDRRFTVLAKRELVSDIQNILGPEILEFVTEEHLFPGAEEKEPAKA